jgi:hypothetical protein
MEGTRKREIHRKDGLMRLKRINRGKKIGIQWSETGGNVGGFCWKPRSTTDCTSSEE